MAFTVDTPRERVRIYTDDSVLASSFTEVINTSGAKTVVVSSTRANGKIWIPLWVVAEGRYAKQSELTNLSGNNFCRELDISALGTNPTTADIAVVHGNFMPERITIYNGSTGTAGIQVMVIF